MMAEVKSLLFKPSSTRVKPPGQPIRKATIALLVVEQPLVTVEFV